MKIAQIAPLAESVPPRLYGGTERVVSYLTEELVRLGQARARQADLFGEIVIERHAVSVREPAPLAEGAADSDEPRPVDGVATATPAGEPSPEQGESPDA